MVRLPDSYRSASCNIMQKFQSKTAMLPQLCLHRPCLLFQHQLQSGQDRWRWDQLWQGRATWSSQGCGNCTWWVRLEGLKGCLVSIEQLPLRVKHEGVQGVALAHGPQVCPAGFRFQHMQQCHFHLVGCSLHPDGLQVSRAQQWADTR